MQLTGIHHLTAISADAPGNVAFYTRVLGMRLVKKTVNQDDVSAYHLFYADGAGAAGHRPHLLRLAGGARAPRHSQHQPHRAARGRARRPCTGGREHLADGGRAARRDRASATAG